MKRVLGGCALAAFMALFVIGAQVLSEGFGRVSFQEKAPTVTVPATAISSDEAIESNLPLLELSTDNQQIHKEEPIVARLDVVDTNGTNDADASPTASFDVALKYRGNSSYATFDKMSYRVTLLHNGTKGADSRKEEASLLGMGEDSEWVLYGPFLDRSLMRNKYMYDLSRDVMEWAPDSRFCELYVDGEYEGVYLLEEPPRTSASRLGLTQFGMVSGETAYMLKRDRDGTEDNPIETYGNMKGYTHEKLSIVYPSPNDITEKQQQWIVNDLTDFETALYSDDFTDPVKGYAPYIDLDSFVDYLLLNEYAMIDDASYLSTYVYRDMDEPLKMAVWDFNNGFDNYPWAMKGTDEFLVVDGNWYNRLVKDRAFVDVTCKRWKELRNGVLSDEQIVARIDNTYASITDDAVSRNTDRWGYTFEESLLNVEEEDGRTRKDPSSTDEAVEMMKATALERAAWMDEHLSDLYEGCVN